MVNVMQVRYVGMRYVESVKLGGFTVYKNHMKGIQMVYEKKIMGHYIRPNGRSIPDRLGCSFSQRF